MGRLRDELLVELKARKWQGMHQNEIYRFFNYSRSHVSETLSSLQKEGMITKKREGRYTNRIWMTLYYPGIVDGVMRVGILRSSEYVPFLSFLRKTAEESGMELAVVIYDSAPDLITALHSYVLEIALAPTFTHILFSLTTGREVLLSSVAEGGSAVISSVKSKSNVLATSESSTMALISRDIARSTGAKIEFFNDPADACEKLLLGDYKYLSIWEPYLSHMLKEEGVKKVENETFSPFTYPCCSAAVNDRFFSEKKDFSLRIGSDYREFIKKMRLEDLAYGIIEIVHVTGFSQKEIEESLKSYLFESDLTLDTLERYMIDVGIPVSVERLRKMLP